MHQLAAVEMQDLVDRGVEQVAVMRDDDDGARVVGEMVLEPQRAFEIEIVGRLIQQQEVGCREQRCRQRHAHPPAAGKFRAGALLIRGGEAEAAEDGGGARRRGMGIDIDETGLDFGDPVRIGGGIGFLEQRGALEVGLEHHRDQARRAVRGFLGEAADGPARRDRDAAGFQRQVAANGVEQSGLADAVAAHETDAGTRRNLRRALVNEQAAGDPDRNVCD